MVRIVNVCAKYHVDNREISGIVLIDRFLVCRVMPVMEVGRGENVTQGPKRNAGIGVDEQSLDAYPDDVGVNRVFCKAKQVDRQDYSGSSKQYLAKVNT